jgi:hypothetical protein
MKRLESACQVAELNMVAWDLRACLASSLPAIDFRQERRRHIVHVTQLHLAGRIRNRNW